MSNEEKQVIVLRKDLNMRKGKMCAQSSHASMAAILEQGEAVTIEGRRYFMIEMDPEMEAWLLGRFKKIALGCQGEQELLALHQQAKDLGLRASLIQDSGLTEFKEPTYTAVAIGPHHPDKIDPVTGPDKTNPATGQLSLL